MVQTNIFHRVESAHSYLYSSLNSSWILRLRDQEYRGQSEGPRVVDNPILVVVVGALWLNLHTHCLFICEAFDVCQVTNFLESKQVLWEGVNLTVKNVGCVHDVSSCAKIRAYKRETPPIHEVQFSSWLSQWRDLKFFLSLRGPTMTSAKNFYLQKILKSLASFQHSQEGTPI